MSIVIYTAIANNYDFPRRLPAGLVGIDFICFADDESIEVAKRMGWRVCPLPQINDDPTRCCREVKLKPHVYLPEYSYSLWVDANIQLLDGVSYELKSLLTDGVKFATFAHPQRQCVYKEAQVCKQNNKDDATVIDEQLSFLKKSLYPSNNGLYETNVLFREHHSPLVIEVTNVWSEMLAKYSRRDQLSLGYALWKCGLEPTLIPGNARGDNPNYQIGPHKKRGIIGILGYIEAYSYGNRINTFLSKCTTWLCEIKRLIFPK